MPRDGEGRAALPSGANPSRNYSKGVVYYDASIYVVVVAYVCPPAGFPGLHAVFDPEHGELWRVGQRGAVLERTRSALTAAIYRCERGDIFAAAGRVPAKSMEQGR
ncbi:hypothetical protein D3C76_1404180 [compost metagenome]